MLNPQQQKAVKTTEGRVLILAGAGSGKTSVIVHRIAHLIESLHTPPEAILGLTFTNKAASEMRKRVADLVGKQIAKNIVLSTFHSFCMQVLRRDIERLGYTKNFSLYDEKDVRRLVTHIARHLLEHEGELPSLGPTIEAISMAKNKALTPDEFQGNVLNRQIYEGLLQSLRAYNAVDFDSLLSLTLKLFEDHPETLAYYQNRFRYIMIDEYQDTNPVQYKIAALLSATHNNLCVVGDDDQAIYGWRGADLQNILRFEASTVIKLEQNYRSTQKILHGANGVIRNNQERHQKELWSAQSQDIPITIFHAPTDADEAQAVVLRMVRLNREQKIPWGEMAILYRSNSLSRLFELALSQTIWEREGSWIRGIPFEVFGGTEFYARSEIKDVTAYLRAIINPLDEEALLRIINVPRRGISEQTLDLLTKHNRLLHKPLWEVLKNPPETVSDRACKSIESFVTLIETMQEKLKTPPFVPSIEWMLQEIQYNHAIDEDVKSEKMRAFKAENIKAFLESLSQFTGSLDDFLASSTMDQNGWHPESDVRKNQVSLMTFHSAKGLEFEACFVVGLEDHILPHEKSLASGSLEEERRLMYVAMTRAKRHLFLSMAKARKRYGKDESSSPSRFLFEIPQGILSAVSWDAV